MCESVNSSSWAMQGLHTALHWCESVAPLLSDPGAKGKWAKRGTLRAQGVMVISGVELQRAVGAVVGWWAWGLCRLVCSQLEPRFLQGSIASACPPSPPIPPHSSTSRHTVYFRGMRNVRQLLPPTQTPILLSSNTETWFKEDRVVF